MPDSADHRDRTRHHRPRDHLLIERPQILQTSSSSYDQDHIRHFSSTNLFDRLRYLLRSPLSLNLHSKHRQLNPRTSSLQDMNRIPNRRSSRTCNQHHPLHKIRNLSLPFRGKKSLCLQLPFQIFKSLVQIPLSSRLEISDDQLIRPTRRIHRHFPLCHHLRPILRLHS